MSFFDLNLGLRLERLHNLTSSLFEHNEWPGNLFIVRLPNVARSLRERTPTHRFFYTLSASPCEREKPTQCH